MKDFETYKEIMLKRGCSTSHVSNTKFRINDFIHEDSIIQLPKNPTFITDADTGLEFVLCIDTKDKRLVRLYTHWLNYSDGSFIEELKENGDITDLFKNNQEVFLHCYHNNDGVRTFDFILCDL